MLARCVPSWHGATMEQKKARASRAGGAIIALTITGGALVGAYFHQPSMGVVIGTVAGIAIALALYVYDRRRG